MLRLSREREDLALCRETLKGLIAYAEHLTWEKADGYIDKVDEAKSLVDAIEAYWGPDRKKDWVKQFDNRVRRVEQGRKPEPLSEKHQIAAINGLYRYSMEMESAQGAEASKEIERAKSYIKSLGNAWGLPSGWTDNICQAISENMEQRQEKPEMGMRM